MTNTSLEEVIRVGGRLVDVDTTGPNVVMFFRSEDDLTEYRVEMFPDQYRDRYDVSNDYMRVEWTAERVEL